MTNTAILIILILRHLQVITAPILTTVLIRVRTTAQGRVHITARGQARITAQGQARIIIHRRAVVPGVRPQKRKEAQIIIIHPILSAE